MREVSGSWQELVTGTRFASEHPHGIKEREVCKPVSTFFFPSCASVSHSLENDRCKPSFVELQQALFNMVLNCSLTVLSKLGNFSPGSIVSVPFPT